MSKGARLYGREADWLSSWWKRMDLKGTPQLASLS